MGYKIGVIGTGYVGVVTGACFAEMGNDVICVDIDEKKIEKLSKGEPTIFEPGLDRLLKNNLKERRLKFTTSLAEAVDFSELIFLCLPTPPNEDGSADLSNVLQVAEDIGAILEKKDLDKPKIVINKSTVPVGAAEKVKNAILKRVPEDKFYVASAPEFLREGFAIEDTLKPDRVVIGTSSDYVKNILVDLYQPYTRSGNPIIVMDERSAEITKYAANSFLATKISFMNDLSAYCEKVGADIEKVRLGIGTDSRIGKRFLFAGIGYGGSCFPKDVRALLNSAEEAGTPLSIVKSAWEVNLKQIQRFIGNIVARFGGDVQGKTFALWGLAFKQNTDDVREAPAFKIIDALLEKGAKLRVYDPEAAGNTKAKYGDKLYYGENKYDAASGADALIIATEWTVFRKPDFDRLKKLLKEPLIFDGRNLYEPPTMEKLGFEYYCVGRPAANPKKI